MKEIRTEIEIGASPSKVWKVFTDFESLGEWSPFIRSIEGEISKGSRLDVFLQPPGSKGTRIRPEVIRSEEGKEFRWYGKLWGIDFIFSGEHYFLMEPTPDGTTRFVQGEKFRGMMVPLLWRRMLGRDTRKGFFLYNDALKKRVEETVT
jgi:hypothetical protein